VEGSLSNLEPERVYPVHLSVLGNTSAVRILHVVQEMGPGGAEGILVTVAQAALEAGHRVAVAATPGGRMADRFGGTMLPLPMLHRRRWRVPGAAWTLRRAIHQWRPDIVQAYNPGMGMVTALATFRGTSPPAFVTVHGVPEEDYRRAGRLLRWSGLPVVACGPGVASGLEEAGSSVLRTIVNGVSPAPPPADRRALADAWGLKPDGALIVCVGRLARAKNQVLAVRALAVIPDATLALVGDGPERDRLRAEATRKEVADRVLFAGYREDARALIGAADAVVIPSRSEGLPSVALEALAAGRPLVATAVRGLRELLTDEVDALLVQPDDPLELAAALRRVLTEPGLGARLGLGAHRLAAQYPVEAMVRGYLELYERLRR
jgi:glycosyltransferase involved in cell wall biosynthesis